MYKKYVTILAMASLLALLAAWNVTEKDISLLLAKDGFLAGIEEANTVNVRIFSYSLASSASGKRIVPYDISEKDETILLSEEDYEALLRIVEAEAGGEDEEGKMLVASVVLNRVKDEAFPDSVKEVVFQKANGKAQFSPVSSGRIYRVKVSEGTIQAVERVLAGEDLSCGALYFAARKRADPKKMRWFDEKLHFLFSHGGHEFFY